jgi:hypothetical protein
MPNDRIAIIMTRLLTDEVLRIRFELDRMKVLGELQAQEGKLTPREFDLFLQSNVDMWSWLDSRIAGTLH